MDKANPRTSWLMIREKYSVPIRNIKKVTDWCSKNISEQKYTIHNRVGGKGWSINFDEESKRWKLFVDSEKTLMFFILDHDDR